MKYGAKNLCGICMAFDVGSQDYELRFRWMDLYIRYAWCG
jgi:hypothetical protein